MRRPDPTLARYGTDFSATIRVLLSRDYKPLS